MNEIGKVIRVEWDESTDEMLIVIEVTDEAFKKRALHNKDFMDILNIKGKSVMVVASKTK